MKFTVTLSTFSHYPRVKRSTEIYHVEAETMDEAIKKAKRRLPPNASVELNAVWYDYPQR